MSIEYKVKLEGSDGKSYVITYEGLWQSLKNQMTYEEKTGWNEVTKTLREDSNKLRKILLTEILIPKAREEMIRFLKENPNIETRSFYSKAWQSDERLLAWYHAKEELEREGIIVSESQGRGKNRTWKIKEEMT